MESRQPAPVHDDPEDPDFINLLDDALEGFATPAADKCAVNAKVADPKSQSAGAEPTPDQSNANINLAEMYKDLQKLVTEAMQNGGAKSANDSSGAATANVDEMAKMVQQLSEEFARADVENSDDPLADTLADLTRTLAGDAEKPADSLDATGEILRRLGAFGDDQTEQSGGGAGGDDSVESLLQFTQTVMSSVLSKAVLYEPLKDMCARYPDWLLKHESQLAAAELQRYRSQLDLMRRVCTVFEEEDDTDGDGDKLRQTNSPAESAGDAAGAAGVGSSGGGGRGGGSESGGGGKEQRQQQVFELMQQMQALGQPPAELVGDSSLDQLDQLASSTALSSDKCSLM